MPIETIAAPAGITAFPSAKVEACLRNDLLQSVASDASLKGIRFPADAPAQSATSIHIDSLVVVELLCGVEPILGFELSDSVVRAGGYSSINQAIEHLMPRIEKTWQKHESKGRKK